MLDHDVTDLQIHIPEQDETPINPSRSIPQGFSGKRATTWFGGVILFSCLVATVFTWSLPILPWVFLVAGLGLGWWIIVNKAWTVYKPRDMFYYAYRSPLLTEDEPVNIWNGIPVGVDDNERLVTITPTDASMIMGGETRSGKSSALRNMISAFVMDPYVDVAIFNGKGGPDYAPFTRVAKVVNQNPVALMNYLAQMEQEVDNRWDRLEELDEEKLTPEISRQEMPVKVIVIDEYRRYIRNKECGPTITESLIEIGAKGAGCGVIIIIANQRVSKDIIDPDLIDNLSLRWAFRVRDSVASNLVLGPGAAGRGFDASKIKRYAWRGVGYLDADGSTPRLVRAFLFEREHLRQVTEQAYQWRREAETLALEDPGMAIDPGDQQASFDLEVPPPRDTLSDFLEVFGAEEEYQWIQTLVNRNAEEHPDAYKIITPKNTKIEIGKYNKILRAAGIKINTQTNIGGSRKSGIKKVDLQEAINRKNKLSTLNTSGNAPNNELNNGNTPNLTAEGEFPMLLLSENGELNENNKPVVISAAELRRNREKTAFDLLSPTKQAAHRAKVADIKHSDFCDYCGWTYTRKDKFTGPTVDHYDPVSDDAPHTQEPWNLRSACWKCNTSKNDSPGGEWYARIMGSGGFDQIHGGPKVNCKICNPHK